MLLFLSEGHDLKVEVSQLSNRKGKLFVALFNQATTFPTYGKQWKGELIEITLPKTSYTFKNISAGAYAIAVFHDENNNGKLDKNVFGAPIEDYGFSNNARETFSAPSFEKAKIQLSQDRCIQIRLD
ncbi:MAG: hypothetical protein RLZZ301_1445 [Bacteroidota bacterium]